MQTHVCKNEPQKADCTKLGGQDWGLVFLPLRTLLRVGISVYYYLPFIVLALVTYLVGCSFLRVKWLVEDAAVTLVDGTTEVGKFYGGAALAKALAPYVYGWLSPKAPEPSPVAFVATPTPWWIDPAFMSALFTSLTAAGGAAGHALFPAVGN